MCPPGQEMEKASSWIPEELESCKDPFSIIALVDPFSDECFGYIIQVALPVKPFSSLWLCGVVSGSRCKSWVEHEGYAAAKEETEAQADQSGTERTEEKQ